MAFHRQANAVIMSSDTMSRADAMRNPRALTSIIGPA
jgi:hypothetical protein